MKLFYSASSLISRISNVFLTSCFTSSVAECYFALSYKKKSPAKRASVKLSPASTMIPFVTHLPSLSYTVKLAKSNYIASREIIRVTVKPSTAAYFMMNFASRIPSFL